MASATLEAADIENSLSDTFMVGVAWTYSTALGWIRLSVGDSDVEAARGVLEETGSIEWPELELDEAPQRCPVCESEELEIVSGARKTLALMLVTSGIPLWFWRSRLRCRACGSSQAVPLRFRPELVAAWLIAAVGTYLLSALVFMIAGFMIRGGA